MTLSRAEILGIAAGILIGCAIGYIDSRPTWDDTGITVGAIVLSAALLSAIAPQRALFVALAVGLPVVVLNVLASGSYASLAALVAAGVGAVVGYGLRRAAPPTTPP